MQQVTTRYYEIVTCSIHRNFHFDLEQCFSGKFHGLEKENLTVWKRENWRFGNRNFDGFKRKFFFFDNTVNFLGDTQFGDH